MLTWLWRLGIRTLEDWGLRLIAPEGQATPELIMFNTISLANQAIDLVAAGLLIVGAARLRRLGYDQGVRGRS